MTEALLLFAPALCATAVADRARSRRLSVRGAVYLAAWNALAVNAAVFAGFAEALLANRFRIEASPAGEADA